MGFEINTKNIHISFGKKNSPAVQVDSTPPDRKTIKLPEKDYTYAPLRMALLPNPAELKQAIVNVNSDPRPMLDIIRKLAVADMHLLGLIETRRDALLGYEWNIESPVEDDEVEGKKCDEIKNRLAKSNFADLIKSLMGGRIYGHSVSVPNWTLDFDNKYIANYETIDFVHFTKKDGRLKLIADKNDKDFNATLGTNYALSGIGISPSKYSESFPLAPSSLEYYDINEEALIIIQSNPFEGLIKNYIGGLMRPALYLTLLKHYNILDWAKFNELFGMPLRVGKFDPLLSSEDAIAILKTAVKNMGTDASAVIDKSTEIELKESPTISRTNTYNDFGNFVESKQSILILGQTLTTEVTSKFGSRAVGDVHNLVRMDKLWGDIVALEPIITKQIIEKDYFYNYGLPPNGLYPKFKLNSEEYKDLQMMSGVVSNLSNAGLEFSKAWAHEFFGTEEPVDPEDSFGGKSLPGLI